MKLGKLCRFACLCLAWGCLTAAFAAVQVREGAGQNDAKDAKESSSSASQQNAKPDKAQAYYHYTLGHLYQERGAMFNRPELLNQAVSELKLALQYDPSSSYLSLELAELYASSGRWESALQEAEDDLSHHPGDIAARKLLGRLYLRILTPDRGGQEPPADLQDRAIKQFEDILKSDPSDISSYLILSQLYRTAGENAKAESTLKKAIDLQPDSADANSNLALLYVDIGDFRAAIDLLKKVANEKADAQIWGTLAFAYEQVQNYKDAAAAYSHAVDGDPQNAAYQRGLGQSLLLSKQYDEALEQFKALIEANPRDVESYLRMSQVYRVQRKFDLAGQALAKAIELAPDNLDLQFNQVLLAESEGKLTEAIGLVKKILDASTRSDSTPYTPEEKASRSVFLEKMGFLYRDQGDLQNAETAFRQMLPLGKDNAIRGELHLIESYEDGREYDKALDAADKALKQYPDSRELILAQASLLASTGKSQAALASLKPLLKNSAEDREIWLAMARVYQEDKRFDQARDAITKADEFSATDDEKEYIHFLYGSIWERQKDYTRAEQEFQKVLAIDPESAMALNYLGYMWADRGVHLDEAVGFIQHALQLEPNSGAYMDSLGWAYFKQNQLDLAARYLEDAFKRLGSDPTILDHLAEIYASSGRLREAQAKWKDALSEWNKLPKNEVDADEVAKVEKKLKEALVKLAQENKEGKP